MRDQSNWSISLGRWGGVHVRLHMVFLVFAAFTLYLSWRETQAAGEGAANDLVWLAALSLAVLAVSVLLHELGHLYAALRTGAGMDEIVLGPLGGLAPPRPSYDPQGELAVFVAGPMVNLGLCVAAAPLLFLQPENNLVGLLHPLRPQGLGSGPWAADAVRLTFWINWVLFCINLIPAFPFDGGRALRAAILLFRPTIGREFAGMVVARWAKFLSLGLIVVAWLVRSDEAGGVAPAWFALVLLAIFLFFSAKQEERRVDELEEPSHLGYEFSSGYASLDHAHDHADAAPGGFFGRWLDRRRETKLRMQRELEAHDELLMDEVLDRVHKYGLQSLSEDERALLHRVSQRYRGRLGNGA
jgi:stage IV sporulation protein FB